MRVSPYCCGLMISILSSISVPAQINQIKAFRQVLERGAIGDEYAFGKKVKEQYDSLVLVYLGEIRTYEGRVLRVLTSRWYWGLAPRATNRIIIFNHRNQYLGDYYLSMTYDLPDRIEDNSLVFVNKSKNEGAANFTTRISFKKGIPRRIFIKTIDNVGDFYTFEQNL